MSEDSLSLAREGRAILFFFRRKNLENSKIFPIFAFNKDKEDVI